VGSTVLTRDQNPGMVISTTRALGDPKLGDEDFGRERFEDDDGHDDAGWRFRDRGANGGGEFSAGVVLFRVVPRRGSEVLVPPANGAELGESVGAALVVRGAQGGLGGPASASSCAAFRRAARVSLFRIRASGRSRGVRASPRF
jgi:hypothetical protein